MCFVLKINAFSVCLACNVFIINVSDISNLGLRGVYGSICVLSFIPHF